MRKELLKQKACPECGNKDFVHDYQKNETVCRFCGYVLEEKALSRKPEWRAFTPEERETRPRASFIPLEVPTQIGPDYDSKGRTIQPSSQTVRLRKWQYRISQDSVTRNIRRAQNILDHLADNLNLSRTVRETTMVIYKRALRKDLIRGRSINGMMTAAVYATCRIMHVPRSPEQISKEANIDLKEINRDYRLLWQELELQIPLVKHSIHIERIAGNLNVSMKSQQLAWEIIQKAQEELLTAGKDPKSLAAAALYIARIQCGEKRTQGEIADIAGVTEVTIRNRYPELAKTAGIFLSDARTMNVGYKRMAVISIEDQMTLFSEKLQISQSVQESAISILNQAMEKNLSRGRNNNLLITACIYAACRINKIPNTLTEFAEVSGFKAKQHIGKTYMLLVRQLNLKIPPSDPKIYITEIIKRLKLSDLTKEMAYEILERAKKEDIRSRTPNGVAAAIIWLACNKTGELKTQNEVARAARTTEVTIRNIYPSLMFL